MNIQSSFPAYNLIDFSGGFFLIREKALFNFSARIKASNFLEVFIRAGKESGATRRSRASFRAWPKGRMILSVNN